MERTVLKNYKGCVDIKDYDREHCIKNKEQLIITHNGQKMTLSPRDVRLKVKSITSIIFESKEKDEPDYRLCSYLWKPDN